jgi:hypothetical protein
MQLYYHKEITYQGDISITLPAYLDDTKWGCDDWSKTHLVLYSEHSSEITALENHSCIVVEVYGTLQNAVVDYTDQQVLLTFDAANDENINFIREDDVVTHWSP